MTLYEALLYLLLLLSANGAPILAARVMGQRMSLSCDFGLKFIDGQRLLGSSKTWRGLLASILLTSLLAYFAGLKWQTGAIVAAYAMLGDLIASFCKRRMRLPSSHKATGLDQIPEALLPLLYLQTQNPMLASDVLWLLLAFFILDKALSRLLFRLKIRVQPY